MFPMLCLCLFRRIDLSSVKTLRMMDSREHLNASLFFFTCVLLSLVHHHRVLQFSKFQKISLFFQETSVYSEKNLKLP